jgi:uncharacterized Rossmann fold enzyme
MTVLDVTPHPPGLVPVDLITGEESGFSAGNNKAILAEYAGDDVMRANVISAVARDVTEFRPSLVVHDGQMVIVGSGPSVEAYADEIAAHRAAGRPIMAVKGAHEWLIEKGITPDVAVSMDSQARSVKFFKTKTPEVCYLLATKVHPDVFDHLADCQVVKWHGWMGDETDQLAPKGACMVGGGSTSGLRAITLAWLMGFRRVWLYGFDSCLRGRQMRVDGSELQQWAMPLQAGPSAPMRHCDAALASQAIEFQEMTFGGLQGIKIKVVGDGLIADIMAERERLGNCDW